MSREVLRQFADAYKAKRKAKSGKALLKSMIESMDTILAENNTKLFEEVVNSLLYNIAKVFQGTSGSLNDLTVNFAYMNLIRLIRIDEMEDDDEDAFEKAARYMGKINLDSTNQPFTPARKCKILIHTAQLYLAEDKYREAEIFVNKCRDHIQAKDIPEMTKLKFWVMFKYIVLEIDWFFFC